MGRERKFCVRKLLWNEYPHEMFGPQFTGIHGKESIIKYKEFIDGQKMDTSCLQVIPLNHVFLIGGLVKVYTISKRLKFLFIVEV